MRCINLPERTMRKRTSVDVVGAALATALGLLGGCGGIVSLNGDGGTSTGEGGDASANPLPGSPTCASPPCLPFHPTPPGPAPPNSGCAAHPCVNPTPVVVANVDTGYDTCAGGALRRRAIVDCPSLVPRAATSCPPVGDASSSTGICTKDSDCTERALGACQPGHVLGEPGVNDGCYCAYGCVRDSDCGASAVCVCADPVGYCAGSTDCSTGQDCQPGCECAALPTTEFQCQTPQDTCRTNADCQAGDPGSCSSCEPGAAGSKAWSCSNPMLCTSPANGRPFLVHGRERVAHTIAVKSWARMPSAMELTASRSLLAAVAAHWARAGLMEHASIASFARFTLHLLALGAPSELVRDAQEAIGDETEHARLAFGLASAFAGKPLGPGPLAIDGALDGFDLHDFVATLIREGCIGETLAAIEAREALEHVTDPAVRAVLEIIARDELRHAALAWRTLGWVVSSGRADRELVRAEVLTALREVRPRVRPDRDDESLRPFGIVDEVRREQLRLMAISSVIGRCATALVGTPGGRPDRTPSAA